MYKIMDGNIELVTFTSLDEAMQFAKLVGSFVTIKGPDFEVCGKFGVDSVSNGMTPDGQIYDWNKAGRIGRAKKEQVYGNSSWHQD
jgi:hypothetical protein